MRILYIDIDCCRARPPLVQRLRAEHDAEYRPHRGGRGHVHRVPRVEFAVPAESRRALLRPVRVQYGSRRPPQRRRAIPAELPSPTATTGGSRSLRATSGPTENSAPSRSAPSPTVTPHGGGRRDGRSCSPPTLKRGGDNRDRRRTGRARLDRPERGVGRLVPRRPLLGCPHALPRAGGVAPTVFRLTGAAVSRCGNRGAESALLRPVCRARSLDPSREGALAAAPGDGRDCRRRETAHRPLRRVARPRGSLDRPDHRRARPEGHSRRDGDHHLGRSRRAVRRARAMGQPRIRRRRGAQHPARDPLAPA